MELLSTSPTLCFNFFLISGLRKFRRGISIVEHVINLAGEKWSLQV